jgi:hypothetical protein
MAIVKECCRLRRNPIMYDKYRYGHGTSGPDGQFTLTAVPTCINPMAAEYEVKPKPGSAETLWATAVLADPLTVRVTSWVGN